MFVTSQGSPYMRLKRAIAQGNPTVALATAFELPRVPLDDALALCLLLLDREPTRYEAAAVRWHSRFCREARPSLADAQLALAALHALPGSGADVAAQCLQSLSERAGHEECAEVLAAWLERRASLPGT
jgi:hypothetical protein